MGEQVTEKDMNAYMMLAGIVLACLAGLGCLLLLVVFGLNTSWAALAGAILAGGVTVASAFGASHYGHKVGDEKSVFNNPAERILDRKQASDLQRARAKVVFERAMVDVRHEEENIVHQQQKELDDPSKPPHVTPWTPPESVPPRLSGPKDKPSMAERPAYLKPYCTHGYAPGRCSMHTCPNSLCEHGFSNGECLTSECSHY